MITGEEDSPMEISTIGIDIGKNSFHFVGFDARGGIVVRRQCSRTQLIRALANLPPCDSPEPDRQPRRLILRSIARQDSGCWLPLWSCSDRSG
jgi:hypothetical protein